VLEFRRPANPWPRFAVYVTAAAVALDLAAEGIEMSVVPELAPRAMTQQLVSDPDQSALQAFNTWHRAAVMLTGFAANGLYTLSAVILASCGRGLFPRWTSFAVAGVALGGFLLSLAALLDWVTGMVLANVLLLPALLLWKLGVWQTAVKHSRITS
jgi:hypothetical protein